MSNLGVIFPEVKSFAEADENYEEQVKSVQDTLLNYALLKEKGEEGDMNRAFLEVELMSMEASLFNLMASGKSLAAAIRVLYSLNQASYSEGK